MHVFSNLLISFGGNILAIFIGYILHPKRDVQLILLKYFNKKIVVSTLKIEFSDSPLLSHLLC